MQMQQQQLQQQQMQQQLLMATVVSATAAAAAVAPVAQQMQAPQPMMPMMNRGYGPPPAPVAAGGYNPVPAAAYQPPGGFGAARGFGAGHVPNAAAGPPPARFNLKQTNLEKFYMDDASDVTRGMAKFSI
jgi:hypothetical protein